MRSLFILFFITLFVSAFYFSRSKSLLPRPISSPSPSPANNSIKVDYHGASYVVYLQKIDQPEKLVLITNFSEKKSSQSIMEENNCAFGVNGGFYTKDDKPLGLFYTNGKLHSPTRPNPLFNGFVYQTTDGSIQIAKDAPSTDLLNFVFQSGPFFSPGKDLSIVNDEKARRILIAQTAQNELYFVAIIESENVNSGPFLADVPVIFQQSNNKTIKQLIFLLNLDGGSASAFFDTKGQALSELTPIGSFLCGQ